MGRRRIGFICVIMLSLLAASARAAAARPLSWSARIAVSPRALDAVSCAGPSLCVAGGAGGAVAVSSNPSGGATAWTNYALTGVSRLTSVSCPSTSLCFATTSHGDVVHAAAPTTGAAAWSAPHAIDGGRLITRISCPSPRLCVAVDRRGGVLSSTHPASSSAWARFQVRRDSFVGVSCPSTGLCVAADAGNHIFASTRPAHGARSWQRLRVLPSDQFLVDVSCGTVHLCVLGNVLNGTDVGFRTSTHPTKANAWHHLEDVNGYPHEGNANAAVSCTATGFCAGFTRSDFTSGDVYVAGRHGINWQNVPANDPSNEHLLMAISCAGSALCAIVDDGGGAIVGS